MGIKINGHFSKQPKQFCSHLMSNGHDMHTNRIRKAISRQHISSNCCWLTLSNTLVYRVCLLFFFSRWTKKLCSVYMHAIVSLDGIESFVIRHSSCVCAYLQNSIQRIAFFSLERKKKTREKNQNNRDSFANWNVKTKPLSGNWTNNVPQFPWADEWEKKNTE